MEILKNFIGGEWSTVGTRGTVPNQNPATGETICQVPMSTVEEVQRAVEAAEKSLPAWSETPAPVRANVIARAAVILLERKEEIARALTQEEGKTLREALGEVQKAVNVLEFISGEGRRLNGETIPSELPKNFCYTLRAPLGVVAILTPWNFPVCIPAWKIAPALLCGNTVVFKPATYTPVTAKLLVEVFAQAGTPKGVLNLVFGAGGTVGNALLEHKAVRAVSFTGSTEVGLGVYGAAAKRGIKCQCEMGGKNAAVVMADADLDLALEGVVQGAFGSTGQRCTATSRVVVQDAIADKFVARLAARAAEIKVGLPLEASSQMGPCVEEGQMKKVLEYVEIGKKEGAQLLTGGVRLTAGALAKGFFVSPAVFDHVKVDHRIHQEEIFGPVLSVVRVKDLDEAIRVSNSVEFGLSGSIYTESSSAAMTFVDKAEVGIVHVNSPTTGGEAQVPFGGSKATGIGQREMGKTAIDFYSEWKVVYFDYTGKKRETNIY